VGPVRGVVRHPLDDHADPEVVPQFFGKFIPYRRNQFTFLDSRQYINRLLATRF
jgi:hypothetical protein